MACLCSLKQFTKRTFGFSYAFCFNTKTFNHVGKISCCLICLTSAVLVHVYVVFPLPICGQQTTMFVVAAEGARSLVSCKLQLTD